MIQRHDYRPGQRVLVEGTVLGYEQGTPFGAVVVRFAEATDPSYLLDGVDAILPQVLVHAADGVDVPGDITGYVTSEGFYPEEDE